MTLTSPKFLFQAPAKRLCPSLGDSGDGMNDLLNHDTIHDNNGGKNTINGVQVSKPCIYYFHQAV